MQGTVVRSRGGQTCWLSGASAARHPRGDTAEEGAAWLVRGGQRCDQRAGPAPGDTGEPSVTRHVPEQKPQ